MQHLQFNDFNKVMQNSVAYMIQMSLGTWEAVTAQTEAMVRMAQQQQRLVLENTNRFVEDWLSAVKHGQQSWHELVQSYVSNTPGFGLTEETEPTPIRTKSKKG